MKFAAFTVIFLRQEQYRAVQTGDETHRTGHEDAVGHTRRRATARVAPTDTDGIAVVIVGADAHIRLHGAILQLRRNRCGDATFAAGRVMTLPYG